MRKTILFIFVLLKWISGESQLALFPSYEPNFNDLKINEVSIKWLDKIRFDFYNPFQGLGTDETPIRIKNIDTFSYQNKFTFILYYPEDYYQNCVMFFSDTPAVYFYPRPAYMENDNYSYYSMRQKNWIGTHRTQVAKMLNNTLAVNPISKAQLHLIDELNMWECFPLLVHTVKTHNYDDYTVINTIYDMMVKDSFSGIFNSSVYYGMYLDPANIEHKIKATEDNCEEILYLADKFIAYKTGLSLISGNFKDSVTQEALRIDFNEKSPSVIYYFKGKAINLIDSKIISNKDFFVFFPEDIKTKYHLAFENDQWVCTDLKNNWQYFKRF